MNLKRIAILTKKEAKQLIRDPLSIALGILLPVVLLLICGYGVSTDVRNIRIAIVVPEPSYEANQIVSRFRSNGFFQSIVLSSTSEAEDMMARHRVDTCLFLPQDFSKRCLEGNAKLLLVVNASNPSPAFLKQGYVQTVLAGIMPTLVGGGMMGYAENTGNTGNAGNSGGMTQGAGAFTLRIQTRQWFNEEGRSALTIVPGMIVIILTLIGALLTSMVMAREYELGNLESMFVTPMRSGEILLAKMTVNFCLGMVGLGIALFLSWFLFSVPIRGNLAILLFGSSIYLSVSLGIGLLISSLTKNQFLAVSATVITTFLPSYLLSGFLFEIKSMPTFLQWFTLVVPARYYVDFL
ncbi:MAG: ABC transporter permease, partial [Planctomycetia bacterium]|nr:ABC transporter permease [Planctomycetia bacterium]